jgi:hypothetical protein
MGYKRLITYILASESGVGLKASNWIEIGKSSGGDWNRKNRPRAYSGPKEQKTLWEAA